MRFAMLLASILLVASAHTQTPSEKKFSIDNCVNKFDPSKIESTKVGYQYWFADKEFIDGRTLKLSVVKPHEATHAPHKHSEDEFFFVLEGKAEFYLEGKTTIAEPYTSFYCPSNLRHGIRNVGDTELKYLVIKKYEKK
jgi:quercetin dioxygenase-like cupin family protein